MAVEVWTLQPSVGLNALHVLSYCNNIQGNQVLANMYTSARRTTGFSNRPISSSLPLCQGSIIVFISIALLVDFPDADMKFNLSCSSHDEDTYL